MLKHKIATTQKQIRDPRNLIVFQYEQNNEPQMNLKRKEFKYFNKKLIYPVLKANFNKLKVRAYQLSCIDLLYTSFDYRANFTSPTDLWQGIYDFAIDFDHQQTTNPENTKPFLKLVKSSKTVQLKLKYLLTLRININNFEDCIFLLSKPKNARNFHFHYEFIYSGELYNRNVYPLIKDIRFPKTLQVFDLKNRDISIGYKQELEPMVYKKLHKYPIKSINCSNNNDNEETEIDELPYTRFHKLRSIHLFEQEAMAEVDIDHDMVTHISIQMAEDDEDDANYDDLEERDLYYQPISFYPNLVSLFLDLSSDVPTYSIEGCPNLCNLKSFGASIKKVTRSDVCCFLKHNPNLEKVGFFFPEKKVKKGDFFKAMSEHLYDLKQLQSFTIAAVGELPQNCDLIFKALGWSDKITYLEIDVEIKPDSEKNLRAFYAFLHSQPNLQTLYLANHKVNNSAYTKLFETIPRIKSLRKLCLKFIEEDYGTRSKLKSGIPNLITENLEYFSLYCDPRDFKYPDNDANFNKLFDTILSRKNLKGVCLKMNLAKLRERTITRFLESKEQFYRFNPFILSSVDQEGCKLIFFVGSRYVKGLMN